MPGKRTDMKVLILSCNTGEGHNSAARALMSHLLSRGIDCTVTDTLSLVGKNASQRVSDFYIYSTRTNLFKHMYRVGMAVSDMMDIVKSPVYLWNKSYSNKLQKYISSNGFDAVICVHLFPAQAMSALRLNGKSTIPTIFVMTDYSWIPFLDETVMDYYVIPHEHLIEEFTSNGIPREKLLAYGIPVSDIFFEKAPKSIARKQIAEHFGWDIPSWKNWFLVMTGSMGFGSTQEIIDETIRQSPDRTEVIVICGRNEGMQKRLQQDNKAFSNIHPVGYTDRIPLLMDACDVLFTKPGGISSTEAISKGIPIIHTAPIPGYESRNAEFFHFHGMSYSSEDIAYQVHIALRLCDDMEYRNTMTGAQRLNAKPDTCHNICSLLTDRVS
jgi:processive 1,2-diacylglycerol beta-glucosyltransferase